MTDSAWMLWQSSSVTQQLGRSKIKDRKVRESGSWSYSSGVTQRWHGEMCGLHQRLYTHWNSPVSNSLIINSSKFYVLKQFGIQLVLIFRFVCFLEVWRLFFFLIFCVENEKQDVLFASSPSPVGLRALTGHRVLVGFCAVKSSRPSAVLRDEWRCPIILLCRLPCAWVYSRRIVFVWVPTAVETQWRIMNALSTSPTDLLNCSLYLSHKHTLHKGTKGVGHHREHCDGRWAGHFSATCNSTTPLFFLVSPRLPPLIPLTCLRIEAT